jgi:glucosyl-dolichyl phosphate glucuronosyltransferase
MHEETGTTGSEQAAVDITMLVCTYNRCSDLRELLETALAQDTGNKFTYEVLVVDNNSTDETRQVVEGFIADGHQNLRYLFEERQGKSHALNRGLEALRGWAYVIADDDFILPKNWLQGMYKAFRDHPDVSFVSGKVLPLWRAEPPAWLTSKEWSAIALADYGDESFLTDQDHQKCLLACAFRLADVKAVGGYDRQLGPAKTRVGGTEDLDLLLRLWSSGRTGLYLPEIHFYHKVEPDRVSKEYHRKWHRDHGRSYAIMRVPETEQGSFRLFDIAGYMYREIVVESLRWLGCIVRGRADEAFSHETRLCFFSGFFRQRWSDVIAGRRKGSDQKVGTFLTNEK